MTVDLLKNMAVTAPRGKALLGLDVGAKTIGVALCDPDWRVATPLTTIKRVKFSKDVEQLGHIVKEYEAGGFIIGYPVNMDGSIGARAQSVRDFALELAQRKEVAGANPWIALFDERLSTATVKEFVDNSVGKRKTRVESKDSGLIDKLAAQTILQGALEYLQNH